MLLLSNMALNTGMVAFFRSFAIFKGFFTRQYCGLIFNFAKPLTWKCSTKILRLKVAKLWLNFGILSQNCDWLFSLISTPATRVQNPYHFVLQSSSQKKITSIQWHAWVRITSKISKMQCYTFEITACNKGCENLVIFGSILTQILGRLKSNKT